MQKIANHIYCLIFNGKRRQLWATRVDITGFIFKFLLNIYGEHLEAYKIVIVAFCDFALDISPALSRHRSGNSIKNISPRLPLAKC